MPDPTPRLAVNVRRVLVEFVTIVVGVLVALAVDEWADIRNEASLEGDYVLRLIDELRRDTADLRVAIALVKDKEDSLLRLHEVLLDPSRAPADATALLRDIGTGTNFAWNAGPLAGVTTFGELQSTGNLRLIDDPEIRLQIIGCYSSALGRERRIEVRSTDFPKTSYTLFLRSPAPGPGTAAGSALELEPDSSVDVARARATVLSRSEAEFPGQVVTEVNRPASSRL